MRFLIISDLHAGEGAKSKVLCPLHDSSSPFRCDDIVASLIDKFKADNLEFDCVILPGDITNSADPDEFHVASEAVKALCNACLTDKSSVGEKIAFTPGNHDVLWGFLMKPSDGTGLWKKNRYFGIDSGNTVFKESLDHLVHPKNFSLLSDGRVLAWKIGDAVIIAYNTALDDGPNEDVHHGVFCVDDVDEIKELAKCYSSTPIKIFIAHHHPFQYEDPNPTDPDFSTMQNAETLMNTLHECGFDLMIHGHKHNPQFKIDTRGGSSLGVMGCGSFSYQLPPNWDGLVLNSAHILEINGGGNGGDVSGKVSTFVHLGNNTWVDAADGVPGLPSVYLIGALAQHEMYFNIFESHCKVNVESVYILDQVLGATDFKYVSYDEKNMLLSKLESELGLLARFKPEKGSSWENIILEKNSA